MVQQTEEGEELARLLALGKVDHELLHSRDDGITSRVACDSGKTIILKLWKRPGVRGFLRRLTQTGNLDREWKTLNHLNRSDFPVPKPITRCHFSSPINGYTDAIVMEDLGVGEEGVKHVSRLLAQGLHDERIRFEKSVIELTSLFIRAGVVDSDHTLVNIIVLPWRGVVRIDFELAVIVRLARIHRRRLARMIAGLMASYVIAAQPQCKTIADDFALRLAKDLKLPPGLLQLSKIYVGSLLYNQQKRSGLDLRWTPPW